MAAHYPVFDPTRWFSSVEAFCDAHFVRCLFVGGLLISATAACPFLSPLCIAVLGEHHDRLSLDELSSVELHVSSRVSGNVFRRSCHYQSPMHQLKEATGYAWSSSLAPERHYVPPPVVNALATFCVSAVP